MKNGTNNTAENFGIENLWVKSYDVYNRLSVNPNHLTVNDARRDYESRIDDDRTEFAQFGANTIEGPIVLGEYRKPRQSATRGSREYIPSDIAACPDRGDLY